MNTIVQKIVLSTLSTLIIACVVVLIIGIYQDGVQTQQKREQAQVKATQVISKAHAIADVLGEYGARVE